MALTPDLEAAAVEAESMAAAWLGSLFCQRLVGAVGSWWELGERQEGASRRWAPACSLGTLRRMWCLSCSQECWWVWGRLAGLWNEDLMAVTACPRRQRPAGAGPSGPASTERLLRLSGRMMSTRVTACTGSCQPKVPGQLHALLRRQPTPLPPGPLRSPLSCQTRAAPLCSKPTATH